MYILNILYFVHTHGFCNMECWIYILEKMLDILHQLGSHGTSGHQRAIGDTEATQASAF